MKAWLFIDDRHVRARLEPDAAFDHVKVDTWVVDAAVRRFTVARRAACQLFEAGIGQMLAGFSIVAGKSVPGNVFLFWNSHDVLRVCDAKVKDKRQLLTDSGW